MADGDKIGRGEQEATAAAAQALVDLMHTPKTRTPKEIYYDLLWGLRLAADMYRSFEAPADKLTAAGMALTKVIRFLDADPTIRAENLAEPLGALATAAFDTAQGGRPEFLFKIGVAANRPLRLHEDFLKAVAVGGADFLVSAGISRDQAASIVATELQKLGRQVDKQKILGWRNNRGRASRDFQDNYALLMKKSTFQGKPLDPSEAHRRVQWILKEHVGSGF